MKTYFDKIRELRQDNDITQSQIANVLQTTQQMYSRYEKGEVELPLKHLITLCKFYKVSSDWVLGLDNITKRK